MKTREEIRKYKSEWARKNHARLSVKRKKWESQNRERLRDYQKEYRIANKERLSLQHKLYYETHRESIKVRVRKYSKDNHKSLRQQRRIYERERSRNDPQFYLGILLRARLRKVLKSNAKVGSAVRDLGCSVDQLKFYLEGKFRDGMTWKNHGKWHIDHIIPLSFFDLTQRAQLLQAVHYTNLQPLWAEENLAKRSSDKLIKTNK